MNWKIFTSIMALMMLVQMVSAGPANGTDITEDANVIYAYADPDTQEMWLSNAVSEPNMWDGGWGSSLPGAGTGDTGPPLRFNISMKPAPTRDIKIDTNGEISMSIVMAAYNFQGVPATVRMVDVVPSLWIGDNELARGDGSGASPQVGQGYQMFNWTLTPGLDTLPKGADLRWQIAVYGAFSNVYLWLGDDPGRSWFSLPVIDPEPVTTTTQTSTGSATETQSQTTTQTQSKTQTTTQSSTQTTKVPPPSNTPTSGPIATPQENEQESPAGLWLAIFGILVVAISRRK